MNDKRNQVSIDAVTVRLNGKPVVMFDVCIGYQDTDLITLSALKRLRNLCDRYIKLGESMKPADSDDLTEITDD